MSDFNQIQLIGHLCYDPDLSVTPKGTAVSKMRIAVNYDSKNKDGNKVEEVLFIDVTCWTKLAEVVTQFCKKGSRVFIIGRLRLKKWLDPEGKPHTKYDITANKVIFLDKAGSGGTSPIGNQPGRIPQDDASAEDPEGQDSVPEEDIPF